MAGIQPDTPENLGLGDRKGSSWSLSIRILEVDIIVVTNCDLDFIST